MIFYCSYLQSYEFKIKTFMSLISLITFFFSLYKNESEMIEYTQIMYNAHTYCVYVKSVF